MRMSINDSSVLLIKVKVDLLGTLQIDLAMISRKKSLVFAFSFKRTLCPHERRFFKKWKN